MSNQFVAEGKTKKIALLRKKPGMCVVISKDDVTAGDGKRHDIVRGKGRLSNLMTCHVFDHLSKQTSVPLAYTRQMSQHTFEAYYCTPIPLEVVVRFTSRGSYAKRNPEFPDGVDLPECIVEFFYKTSGRKIGNVDIACDDPLLVFEDGVARLHHPSKSGEIILDNLAEVVDPLRVAFLMNVIPTLTDMADKVGQEILCAWQQVGGNIDDFKIEFGIDRSGKIKLIDVLDVDSMRAWYLGQDISKDGYRKGGSVNDFFEVLVVGEAITRSFKRL